MIQIVANEIVLLGTIVFSFCPNTRKQYFSNIACDNQQQDIHIHCYKHKNNMQHYIISVTKEFGWHYTTVWYCIYILGVGSK